MTSDLGGVQAGDDLRVLVAQLTTDGEVSVTLQAPNPEGIPRFHGRGGDPHGPGRGRQRSEQQRLCGCTDVDALNYDESAEYNDGSCIDVVEGCTDASACNYDALANTDDGSCLTLDCAGESCGGCDYDETATIDDVDECGHVCGGPGAVYACGCTSIPEGDCDCEGNQLDALGICGGDCAADEDADGICDDVDDCVGALDACGVCNGPGVIYECGCTDIPEGDCDCDGNQEDALGCVWRRTCAADMDADGICDDVDDCVGAFDACGVCNGPGEIYECGCSDIPEGTVIATATSSTRSAHAVATALRTPMRMASVTTWTTASEAMTNAAFATGRVRCMPAVVLAFQKGIAIATATKKMRWAFVVAIVLPTKMRMASVTTWMSAWARMMPVASAMAQERSTSVDVRHP